eukprot:11864544-Alexandrium_andersonii.AAC.1
MPHGGQQPAGCETACQWAVQASGGSSPPSPRACATQAAPSAVVGATGRQPVHQATPSASAVGVSHAAPTASLPQQQHLRGRKRQS